ncbi:MAG: hypothetical protein Q8Q31_04390 [Nanoarchaeota archaeon]|nr:hypothetical protein [Nanoarchaeota archaeon]
MKLFIFGPTGDLVRRKVLPALQSLDKEMDIWALGRRDFTDEDYSDFVCKGLCTTEFAKKLKYRKIDLNNDDFLEPYFNLFDKNEVNLFYIALPPDNIKKILFTLAKIKSGNIRFRVLIEKPFGENLNDAQYLRKIILDNKLSEEVYLSDHYLFKENIVDLTPINFKELKLISLENVGLEGRNTYYEGVGALNDMVQSHFFNIVFKLLENPEEEFDSFEVIDIQRAQYSDGKGESYEKELGKKSETETFVKMKIKTREKTFEFITGKGFSDKLGILGVDSEKIDLHGGENAYVSLFSHFFEGRKNKFPSIDNSILAWKIIESIDLNKVPLEFYGRGESSEDFLKSTGLINNN